MVYGPQSKPGEKKLHIIHISSMSDWGFPIILVSDVEDKTQIQHINGFRYAFRLLFRCGRQDPNTTSYEIKFYYLSMK